MSFTYTDSGVSVGNARAFIANSLIYAGSFGAVQASGALNMLPMYEDFAEGNMAQRALAVGGAMSAAQEGSRIIGYGNAPSNILNMHWATLGDEVLYNGLIAAAWEMAGVEEKLTDLLESGTGAQAAGYAAFGVLCETSQIARAALARKIAETPTQVDDNTLGWILQPFTRLTQVATQ